MGVAADALGSARNRSAAVTVWMKWHRTENLVTGMSVFLVEPDEWDLQTSMSDAQSWVEALAHYGPEIISTLNGALL